MNTRPSKSSFSIGIYFSFSFPRGKAEEEVRELLCALNLDCFDSTDEGINLYPLMCIRMKRIMHVLIELSMPY